MFKKIAFELFIIEQLMKIVWFHIKRTRSLRPISLIFSYKGSFDLGDGVIRKGGYYTYLRASWKKSLY
jgi:hypothetical protein